MSSPDDAPVPTLVKVSVTQDDINHGERRSCARCPVARAMTRALGKPVSAGPDGWWTLGDGSIHRFPLDVRANVMAYDEIGLMVPFEFEVSDAA